jgi:hypothetical protein
MTCFAPVVAVGTFAKFDVVKQDGNWLIGNCHMNVTEQLKGPAQAAIVFRVRCLNKPLVWMQPGTELLAYLQPSPPADAQQPNTPPLKMIRVFRIADLVAPLCDMNMRSLTSRDDVLSLCRDWAHSSIHHFIDIEVPHDSPVFAMWQFNNNLQMRVPAAERYRLPFIEQAHSGNPDQRVHAALMLARFPGPETEAVLNRLLGEGHEMSFSMWCDDTALESTCNPTLVQAAAAQSLRELGQNVPQGGVNRRKTTAEEQSTFRLSYWARSIYSTMPSGGWRVVSVEDGPSQPVADERVAVTVVHVKCARGDDTTTFTLMPKEWTSEAPWQTQNQRCLGISRDLKGARVFYVKGWLDDAWRRRLTDTFRLQGPEK